MRSSTDGGRSFKAPPGPERFVAGVPYLYDPTRGQRSGLFNPSDIRPARRDYFYTMMTSAAQGEQKAGVCLMRTDRLDDPAAWRGWNRRDFTVKPTNPTAHRRKQCDGPPPANPSPA